MNEARRERRRARINAVMRSWPLWFIDQVVDRRADADVALVRELARLVANIERMRDQARMGGEGVGVRLREPAYLADLLRRTIATIEGGSR